MVIVNVFRRNDDKDVVDIEEVKVRNATGLNVTPNGDLLIMEPMNP